tara:strand:- start:1552 stop:2667 length:1116 start_codon:yes stop_codon:yes gene_type:complete
MTTKIASMGSFRGNIGDILSNDGLEYLFFELFGNNYQVKRFELRKTFRNYTGSKRIVFNKDFASDISSNFDYFFIGGGSMLEPFSKLENGIRLEITHEFLDNIKIPIIFTSVGAAPRSKLAFSEKSKLVERICKSKNIFKGFRADGSFPWIQKKYKENLVNCFEVVDNAFLSNTEKFEVKKNDNKPYFILNLAFDQFKELSDHCYKTYLKNISKIIELICKKRNLFIFLVPHTPQDLFMASDIIKESKETIVREFFNISEYNSGEEGLPKYVNLYMNAEFAFCTRFHSTILSDLTNTPIISVGVLDRIEYMINSSKINCKKIQIQNQSLNSNLLDNIVEEVLNFSNKNKELKSNYSNIAKETINLYKTFIN